MKSLIQTCTQAATTCYLSHIESLEDAAPFSSATPAFEVRTKSNQITPYNQTNYNVVWEREDDNVYLDDAFAWCVNG